MLSTSPEMFGDLHISASCVTAGAGKLATVRAPLVGLGSKVGENNHALPRDRAYYTFNYFHNAFEFDITEIDPGGNSRLRLVERPLLRHTIGYERTYFDGLVSVEARMPVFHSVDQRFDDIDIFEADVAEIGNVFVITKVLLYQTSRSVFSSGLGIDIPTGDDSLSRHEDSIITMENDAVGLHPFLAYLWTPNDQWFVSSFSQLDFVTNGNSVFATDLSAGVSGLAGRLNRQTMVQISMSLGRWLYRRDYARTVHSLATILEAHYTGALQGADTVQRVTFDGLQTCTATAHGDRPHIVNLTTGIHAAIGRGGNIRLAYGLPLTSDRAFDGELMVQINYLLP